MDTCRTLGRDASFIQPGEEESRAPARVITMA